MGARLSRRLFVSSPLLLLTGAGGAADPKSSGPPNGTLVVVGGGTNSRAVIEACQQASGGQGARWVVIPSAQNDQQLADPKVPDFVRATGNFKLLHTRDRAVANTEAFVAPLREATAVWFDGGRQWRLADTYGETRTETALHELLARGGLIAGSSAGATIQGSYLVRGSPAGNGRLMAPGHERGFGFLKNVAIDQHIVTRGREADLARLVAIHPNILGIGIDESTAIVVRGNVLSVVGPSLVAITDGDMHQGRPYYALRQGARFDLATWTVLGA